tara:strand:- start:20 stop:202 length:183 start_codon:yes stop_codon:yes gene_type:complete
MLDLIKRFELIQKRQVSQYMSGHIENIFLYNENCRKNEDGTIPVCIKPDPVETKKKKSIN